MPTSKHFANNIILASAGTGKTFALSNRYIGLVAQGESVDSILATTFTKKAAGEILDRVVQRIAAATNHPDKLDELRTFVEKSLNREKCLTILRNILSNLHRLRVSTLDSFFNIVSQMFSLELGLPLGWSIIDEPFDFHLRHEAVKRMLAAKENSETVKLVHLLFQGETKRAVVREILQVVIQLHELYLDAPREAWFRLQRKKELNAEQIMQALQALHAVLTLASREGTADLGACDLATIELPPPTPAIDLLARQDYFPSVAEFLDKKRNPQAVFKDLERAASGDWDAFLQAGVAAALTNEGTFYKKDVTAFEPLYAPLINHAQAIIVNRIANKTEGLFNLLKEFDEYYSHLKQEYKALLFHDIPRAISRGWFGDEVSDEGTDNTASTDYRIDTTTRHLLLDEFQDTSLVQWNVLSPFAEKIDHLPTDASSFFCVGDVKQAIYGWRGGVAELFGHISEQLHSVRAGVPLEKSFRSAPEIIDTVNFVFGAIGSCEPLVKKHPEATATWANRFTQHQTAKTNLPGYCQLAVAHAAEQEKPNAEERRSARYVYLAEQVERLLEKTQGQKSIGILLRSNKSVSMVVAALKSRGIEASEEGGVPLTGSPAVELLLSFLTLLDHPGNSIARTHLATSPLASALGYSNPFDETATETLALRWSRRLGEEGLFAVLDELATALTPHCTPGELERLNALLTLASQTSELPEGRTSRFVEVVRSASVESPSAAPVRVMTLHKSKGLEFDLVFLPELDTTLGGRTSPVVVGRKNETSPIETVLASVPQKLRKILPQRLQEIFPQQERLDVEEALCVLYVGMTRAAEGLYLVIDPLDADKLAKGKQTTPCTFGGILQATLAPEELAKPGAILFSTGNEEAVLTCKPSHEERSEDPKKVLDIRLATSDNLRHKIRSYARKSPSGLEGDSRVKPSEVIRQTLTRSGERAREEGTLVHRWFELIAWLDTPPDREQFLLEANTILSNPENAPKLFDEFLLMLQKPALQKLLTRKNYPADTKLLCEWEFTCLDNEVMLRGIVDRLVVLCDGGKPVSAAVYDYKTDHIASVASLSEKQIFYQPQLDAYQRAVCQFFKLPPEKVTTELVFVRN